MNTYTLRKRSAVLGLLTGSLALFAATSGLAQPAAAPTTAPATEKVEKLEKFVVTGSLLPQSEAVTASPVVSLDAVQFEQSGATDVLDFFRKETPYFFGNGNIGREINNTSDGSHGNSSGESQVQLRNFTTLVLLDGRRIVGSPNSSGSAVDVNTIPNAMIDHIEIVKDGASTLYGSDAIAGVVNVITKKNYNGFELTAKEGFDRSHAYKTEEYSVVGGAAKDDTSLVVAIDYSRNSPIKTTARPITNLSAIQLGALGRSGSPSYFSTRFPGYVAGNILAGSPLAIGAPGYNASKTSPPVKTTPNAPAVTFASLVANGTYIPINTTPASVALGGSTGILNTTSFGTYTYDPSSHRQFMANFNRDIFGNKLQFFADFLYTSAVSTGAELAPGPSGPGSIEVNNMIIPANNPYNFYSQTISSFPGGFSGSVRSRFVDVGNRAVDTSEDTYRVISGFKGNITDNFSWEVGVNFSHANYKWLQRNAINGYSFNAAETPLLTAAGGYTYDSNGKPLSILTDGAGNVPIYNYFGLPGSNDPRTIQAIRATLFQAGATDLKGIDALVRGSVFDLPAGKVGLAVGADYRAESLVQNVDQLYSSGYVMGGLNPIADFAGGKRNTKSIFGEVDVPLVSPSQNMAGAYSLDFDVSGRHEELSGGSKSNIPKLGLKWQPVNRDLTLRGSYSKGFAAPTIFDLFGPTQSNSPQVTLFDASSGKPSSIQMTSSELSNPGLAPNKSKAWTGGVVYSPHQIKGLDLSLDYYYIFEDGVGGIDYQSIVNDLNAKGSGSFYAAGYRDVNGNPLTTTAANQVTVQTVGQVTVQKNPSGDQKMSGFDLGASYRFELTDVSALKVSSLATITRYYKFRATPKTPYADYAGYYTNGNFGLGAPNLGTLPDYNIKLNFLYTYRGFAALLSGNYVPRVVDPGDTFGGQGATDSFTVSGKPYNVPSYQTWDLRFGYNFNSGYFRGMSVSIGAANLFDKKPLFLPSAAEDNTDKQTYDIIGRFVSFEVGKKF